MKLLLTSSGIKNSSIHATLEELLGKPISESSALMIPTAIYPYPGGGNNALDAISGRAKSPLCELGWQSLGVLELTALPSVRRENWVPIVQETDALLVWGGNVTYLYHWMRKSGLADLLGSLENLVYVGVSAGAIVTTAFNCDGEWNRPHLPSDVGIEFGGNTALGLTDFALWVHADNPDPIFEDHTMDKIEAWAADKPFPTYALDDQSAIAVVDGAIDVISEGHWRLFPPSDTKN